MKSYDEISASVIERRDEYKTEKKKRNRKLGTSAGIICAVLLVAVGAASVSGRLKRVPTENPNGPVSHSDRINNDSTAPLKPGGYAVYVPAVKMPEYEDGMYASMISLISYKGNVYTFASMTDEPDTEHLLDRYIGEANPIIDEYSKKTDYSNQLASTMSGSVYTVKGYSEDFRLCVVNEIGFTFLEKLNGVGFNKGSELFGDRLNLKGRITDVKAESFDSWNYDKGELFTPTLSEDSINQFLDALYSGTFYDCRTDFTENGTDVYDTDGQGFIHLILDDGTTVLLRLFRDGKVMYDGLGWYAVEMPGEAFDAMYNACKYINE